MAELALKIDPTAAVAGARKVRSDLNAMADAADRVEKEMLGLGQSASGDGKGRAADCGPEAGTGNRMFQFGLSNLRRLRDMPLVDIRPITILVGRNSSGKSTFLRTFPLLRQSLLTRTSSPILWYGDYVDFGSFKGAVSDNDVNQEMTFTFGVDDITYQRQNSYIGYYSPSVHKVGHTILKVSIAAIDARTYLSAFSISFDNGRTIFQAQLNELGQFTQLLANGVSIIGNFSDLRLFAQVGSIFPTVRAYPRKIEDQPSFFSHQLDPLASKVSSAIKPHLNNRIRKEKLDRAAAEFLSISAFNDAELKRLEARASISSFRKLISEVRANQRTKIGEELRRLHMSSIFVSLAESVFDRLRKIVSQTLYIGPMRARSERYYRYQDLAVSEIDPDGQNFPMFLNSLHTRQITHFSDWVRERFGYGVQLSKPQEHISINLLADNKVTNIVDNGFGISQVLPVLGQIWWAANRPRNALRLGDEASTPIIAIEQPELHLHPAHQALLADALVADRDETGAPSARRLHFIIETHSEALVNRLGELIALGKLPSGDVQILVFDKDQRDDRSTIVRRSDFDPDGALLNWPYGFFQPDPA